MKTITWIERIWRTALLGVLASPALVLAQTVISAPSTGHSAGPRRPGFGGTKPASYSDISSAFASLAPLAKWGSVNIRPHVNYQLLYAEGILRVPGAPTNTTQHALTFGILSNLGKHWTLDYTAGRTWNSTRLLADYTSHDVNLSGGISKGNWTAGIFQTYTSKSTISVETGQQIPETSLSTGGNVSYQVGVRTLLDLQVSRNTRKSDLGAGELGITAPDMEQWTGTGSMHYRFSPQLDVAIGMRLGFDSISNSPDMNVSEPQVTINWRPTSKISLTAQGGFETRKFKSGSADNLNTQVYSATASYQPTEYTTFSVSGNKNITPTYFANQVSRSSGWGVSAQQRFLQRFYVSAGFSTGRTRYLAIDQEFVVGRDEEFNSFNARLSTTFLQRGSISLFYQNSRNSSNDARFRFDSHQIGTDIGYRF